MKNIWVVSSFLAIMNAAIIKYVSRGFLGNKNVAFFGLNTQECKCWITVQSTCLVLKEAAKCFLFYICNSTTLEVQFLYIFISLWHWNYFLFWPFDRRAVTSHVLLFCVSLMMLNISTCISVISRVSLVNVYSCHFSLSNWIFKKTVEF